MKIDRLIIALLCVMCLLGCSAPRIMMAEPEREIIESPVSSAAFSAWIDESFVVSYDSRRVAYIEESGDKYAVVLDGKKGKEYEGIYRDWLDFSPDSQRLVYVVMEGDKRFVVVDGEEGKRYDDILLLTPVFSQDSKKFGYVAKLDDKWFSVIEGQEWD